MLEDQKASSAVAEVDDDASIPFEQLKVYIIAALKVCLRISVLIQSKIRRAKAATAARLQ